MIRPHAILKTFSYFADNNQERPDEPTESVDDLFEQFKDSETYG